jgi:hypothetical protein
MLDWVATQIPNLIVAGVILGNERGAGRVRSAL